MRFIILFALLLLSGCVSHTEAWFGDLEKVNNPRAVDVSYVELVAFLEADETDKHEWVLGEYVCVHFATDLHNNAEAAGIRACIVQTNAVEGEVSHCFNVFETTDKGLVFVDLSGSCDYRYSYFGNTPELLHYYW